MWSQADFHKKNFTSAVLWSRSVIFFTGFGSGSYSFEKYLNKFFCLHTFIPAPTKKYRLLNTAQYNNTGMYCASR